MNWSQKWPIGPLNRRISADWRKNPMSVYCSLLFWATQPPSAMLCPSSAFHSTALKEPYFCCHVPPAVVTCSPLHPPYGYLLTTSPSIWLPAHHFTLHMVTCSPLHPPYGYLLTTSPSIWLPAHFTLHMVTCSPLHPPYGYLLTTSPSIWLPAHHFTLHMVTYSPHPPWYGYLLTTSPSIWLPAHLTLHDMVTCSPLHPPYGYLLTSPSMIWLPAHHLTLHMVTCSPHPPWYGYLLTTSPSIWLPAHLTLHDMVTCSPLHPPYSYLLTSPSMIWLPAHHLTLHDMATCSPPHPPGYGYLLTTSPSMIWLPAHHLTLHDMVTCSPPHPPYGYLLTTSPSIWLPAHHLILHDMATCSPPHPPWYGHLLTTSPSMKCLQLHGNDNTDLLNQMTTLYSSLFPYLSDKQMSGTDVWDNCASCHSEITDHTCFWGWNTSAMCWACCPAWCSVVGLILIWASGRGDFFLGAKMDLDSIPQNSFGWDYKPRSSLCTCAFYCTDWKDPDIHVLDGWMPATKTNPACTNHKDGMCLPLWLDQKMVTSTKISHKMENPRDIYLGMQKKKKKKKKKPVLWRGPSIQTPGHCTWREANDHCIL